MKKVVYYGSFRSLFSELHLETLLGKHFSNWAIKVTCTMYIQYNDGIKDINPAQVKNLEDIFISSCWPNLSNILAVLRQNKPRNISSYDQKAIFSSSTVPRTLTSYVQLEIFLGQLMLLSQCGPSTNMFCEIFSLANIFFRKVQSSHVSLVVDLRGWGIFSLIKPPDIKCWNYCYLII